MRISYSRESTYLRCPYQHYLSYVRNLTPNKPIRPLQFGSDFHRLLEVRGNKKAIKKVYSDIKETYYAMPSDWQTDLGDNYLDAVKTIFQDYLKVYRGTPLPYTTEHRFEIPMFRYKGKEVTFLGVIDGLYKTEDGILVEEHKTFSQKPSLTTLTLNVQKCLYAHAVEVLTGELPKEVVWDYIKSTPADEPIWLEKSQRFSQSKSEKITPFSYLRAAKAKGLDLEQAKKDSQLYEGNIPNFYFRVPMPYTREMVTRVWEDFVYTAKEICSKGETNKTMNLTRDCAYCSFCPICTAELTGGNVEYTISHDYKEKDNVNT